MDIERALITSSLNDFTVVKLSIERLGEDLSGGSVSLNMQYQFGLDNTEDSSQGVLHLRATIDATALPSDDDEENPIVTLQMEMLGIFSANLPPIDEQLAGEVHRVLDESPELRGVLWSKVFPAVREVLAFNLTKVGIEAAASMPWSFDSDDRRA